jgi:hypothetical protein
VKWSRIAKLDGLGTLSPVDVDCFASGDRYAGLKHELHAWSGFALFGFRACQR